MVSIGFFVLMIVAGTITAMTSPQYWNRPGDVFLASALAGGTPVMLFWVIFLILIVVCLGASVAGGWMARAALRRESNNMGQ
jgi:heme/copper-type cytochrome/quinol oxidase subunit 2